MQQKKRRTKNCDEAAVVLLGLRDVREEKQEERTERKECLLVLPLPPGLPLRVDTRLT